MEAFISAARNTLQQASRAKTGVRAQMRPLAQNFSTASLCPQCQARTPYSKKGVPSNVRHARTASTSASGRMIEEPFKADSTTTSPPKTHYEFFPDTLSDGPPPSGPFIINLRTLRNEFLRLQAVAHPDRHPSHLKARAEATSARINEAYKTLQSPLLRAQYLLSTRGINVAEDETAKVEDPELLMEVLEAREEIEAAEEEAELEDMRTVNDERIVESERVLADAFAKDDIDTARAEAVRLRYWINIKDSLDAWEKGKPVVQQH